MRHELRERVENDAGRPVIGAQAYLRNFVSGTLVSVYPSEDSQVPLLQPLVSERGGYLKAAGQTVYVEEGTYLLELVVDGLSTTFRYEANVAGNEASGGGGGGSAIFTDLSVTSTISVPAGSISQASIAGLGTSLAGKSDTGHGHAIADIATLSTQLAGKQPLGTKLTNLQAVTGAANMVPYFNGADTFATASLTTFGRSLIDDANASAARSTLELTGAATMGLPVSIANGGTGATDAAAARDALGLKIGTNVLAYSGEIQAIAGLTTATGYLARLGTQTWGILTEIDGSDLAGYSVSVNELSTMLTLTAHTLRTSAGLARLELNGPGEKFIITEDVASVSKEVVKLSKATGLDLLVGTGPGAQGNAPTAARRVRWMTDEVTPRVALDEWVNSASGQTTFHERKLVPWDNTQQAWSYEYAQHADGIATGAARTQMLGPKVGAGPTWQADVFGGTAGSALLRLQNTVSELNNATKVQLQADANTGSSIEAKIKTASPVTKALLKADGAGAVTSDWLLADGSSGFSGGNTSGSVKPRMVDPTSAARFVEIDATNGRIRAAFDVDADSYGRMDVTNSDVQIHVREVNAYQRFGVDTTKAYVGAGSAQKTVLDSAGASDFAFADKSNVAVARNGVRAYRSALYAAAGGAFPYEIVRYDTEAWDPDARFNPATYRYTAPVTGYYRINAQVAYNPSAAGRYILELHKNSGGAPGSATMTQRLWDHHTNLAGNDQMMTGTTLIKLTAGDYIELYSRGSANYNVGAPEAYTNVVVEFAGI